MSNLFGELKRRNVFKVAVAYVIVGWVVLQVAETIAPLMNLPDSLNQYILFFLIVGFPITIFFSWVYELTPEGLKKQSEVDKDLSLTEDTGRKIDFIIIGALILAIGGLVWDRQNITQNVEKQDTRNERRQASIAVLPFVNMSSDPEQEYFSDGISEELLNLLAKIPEMSVIGRTSSFAYKGKTPDLRDVGKALGVAHVLEGSVRKQGLTVRITAQLIDTSNGKHLWSETYDRDLEDVFAVQDEIASAITSELKIRILGEGGLGETVTKPVSVEAHNFYLMGLAQLNQNEFKTLLKAQDYFKKAYEASPEYLEAYEGYGMAISSQFDYGAIDREVAVKELETTLHAIRLIGGEESPVSLALASYLAHYKEQFETRSLFAEKALAAAPNNPFIVKLQYRRNSNGGRNKENVVLLNKALLNDPMNKDLLFALVRTYMSLGQFDKAEVIAQRGIIFDPEYAQAYSDLARIQLAKGEFFEGLKSQYLSMYKDAEDPDGPAFVVDTLMNFGFLEQAEVLLNKAENMSKDEVLSIALRAKLELFKGNVKEAAGLAEGLILSKRDSRHSSNDISFSVVLFAILNKGEVDRFAKILMIHIPEFEKTPTDFETHNEGGVHPLHRASHASELAEVLIAKGEDKKATEILEAALNYFQKRKGGFIFLNSSYVKTLALMGRTDEAFSVLEKAKGHRNYFEIFSDRTWRLDLKGLIGHPEYDKIAAEMDVHLEGERQKIAAWLANGGGAN